MGSQLRDRMDASGSIQGLLECKGLKIVCILKRNAEAGCEHVQCEDKRAWKFIANRD